MDTLKSWLGHGRTSHNLAVPTREWIAISLWIKDSPVAIGGGGGLLSTATGSDETRLRLVLGAPDPIIGP